MNEEFNIENCLSCDGLRKYCNSYEPFENVYRYCTWYFVVISDLEKIKDGERINLTFPQLLKIYEDYENRGLNR